MGRCCLLSSGGRSQSRGVERRHYLSQRCHDRIASRLWRRLAQGREDSFVGRKRNAAFGTRRTSCLRAISMLTLAVIPGLSFRSTFGTSITVAMSRRSAARWAAA